MKDHVWNAVLGEKKDSVAVGSSVEIETNWKENRQYKTPATLR